MNCIFCSLLLDSPPTKCIARNDHAAAFLPLTTSSLAPGHTLVIPTSRCAEVQEVDSTSLNATMAMVQQVTKAMLDRLGATGVNLLCASGPGSEQSVSYLHSMWFPAGQMTGSRRGHMDDPLGRPQATLSFC